MTTTHTPDWQPLEARIGRENCAYWMYMACYDGRIHAYKHQLSRDYIHLDNEGNCYLFTGDGFAQTDFDEHWKYIQERLEMFQ